MMSGPGTRPQTYGIQREFGMDRIEEIRAQLALPPRHTTCLTENELWSPGAPLFWTAERVGEPPHFYPVYRCGTTYSWSILALVVRKGSLVLNDEAARAAEAPGFRFFPSVATIDREIERVGSTIETESDPDITDPEHYAAEIAAAVRDDVAELGSRADVRPFVLVGGRDSMNLLLLPWRERVTALSASPNFALVRRFVQENDLDVEVEELTDPEDPRVLDREILENTCRADLEHYRWGARLREIAIASERPVVFWKGQMADAFMTPYWKKYAIDPGRLTDFVTKAWARTDFLLPGIVQRAVARRILLPRFRDTVWLRGANWQGFHMTVIRGTSGALPLSAYHGPRMQRVFARVDLTRAAQRDIRPRVGELLLGRPVRYPAENPGPPPSAFRRGLGRPGPFLERIRRAGIPVT
ncbi:MAG: hypothetical protein H6825_07445 [Planctomycetes bacterium]|nr:hypothetical protein [Planctomycetota bacterium]